MLAAGFAANTTVVVCLWKGWVILTYRHYFSAFALVILLIAAGACSRAKETSVRGDSTNPINVRVFPVTEQSVPRSVQAVGSLFPLDESVISSQVEGKVDKVLADVGDRVALGQVLVTLDPVELILVELKR